VLGGAGGHGGDDGGGGGLQRRLIRSEVTDDEDVLPRVDAGVVVDAGGEPGGGGLQLVDADAVVPIGVEVLEEGGVDEEGRRRRRGGYPLGLGDLHRLAQLGEGVAADVDAATEAAIDDGHENLPGMPRRLLRRRRRRANA
jgi:hypothetical protein